MITFKTYRDLEGYFNKDEQGWCGYRIEVICEDGKVTYRHFFDANGRVESEKVLQGKITRTENDIVYITLENGLLLEYSLKEEKLIKF
jgi:hypothetical protein